MHHYALYYELTQGRPEVLRRRRQDVERTGASRRRARQAWRIR
jgi:hypothetical protein